MEVNAKRKAHQHDPCASSIEEIQEFHQWWCPVVRQLWQTYCDKQHNNDTDRRKSQLLDKARRLNEAISKLPTYDRQHLQVNSTDIDRWTKYQLEIWIQQVWTTYQKVLHQHAEHRRLGTQDIRKYIPPEPD